MRFQFLFFNPMAPPAGDHVHMAGKCLTENMLPIKTGDVVVLPQ